jgi:hypothetical protein
MLRPQCWWTSFAIVALAGFSSQREREETYCSSPPQLSTQSIVEFDPGVLTVCNGHAHGFLYESNHAFCGPIR